MKRQLRLRIGDEEFSVVARRDGNSIIIERDGEEFTAVLESESFVMEGETSPTPAAKAATPARKPSAPAPRPSAPASTPSAGPGSIVSPMVGVVKEVLVEPGATVDAGDRVVVLEAMKMDIDVVSHDAGTVAEVNVAAGTNVTEGQQLARIESGGGA